jgi:hypothetical protein
MSNFWERIIYCEILDKHDFSFMEYFMPVKFWDKINIKWCYRCGRIIGEYKI